MWRSAVVPGLLCVLGWAYSCRGEVGVPARAVLFIIDGVHWQAPERLGLGTMRRLASQGVYFKRAHCLAPAHPTTGAYGAIHTTSVPNPTLQAGTLFLRPETKMVQECFWPERLTAHAVNIIAYRSLNRGFHLSAMLNEASDEVVTRWAIRFMEDADVRFARFHLQDAGTAGAACAKVTEDVPWRGNIWGEGSPYVAALRKADGLLAEFVGALKRMGKWDDTLLVVMADHGQASGGWHPPMQEEGWLLPLILVGPGVAKGRVYDYAETIDVVPTMCDLMGVKAPSVGPGSGVVLEEVRAGFVGEAPKRPHRVRAINEQIREYELLKAKLTALAANDPVAGRAVVLAERGFYGIDRILDWHETGSIDGLIETNRRVIGELERAVLRCCGVAGDHRAESI
ncbi:MAG: sulfatase-like hydrolase/transferase [Phycisphaerae bacterium]|nr:sulfatase-like hydrolase/transferase [Phycisphaerae bacterium]